MSAGTSALEPSMTALGRTSAIAWGGTRPRAAIRIRGSDARRQAASCHLAKDSFRVSAQTRDPE